jgi:hypothetical protein
MIKTIIFPLIILTIFGGCKEQAAKKDQSTYKGLPLIKAKSIGADYKIGNEMVKGSWSISPQIEFDSLIITCHSDSEVFGFYTDIDSIKFDLEPEKIHKFYVSLNDTAYALTVIKGVKASFLALQFDVTSKNSSLKFWYEQNNNNEFLNQLRSKHPIDSLVKDAKTDTEKTLKILHWVHNRWKHDGENEPKKSDAISILEEAKQGKRFRCVEYGIVATACLNAVGLKTRVLGLKTKDVETRQYGAGHVLLEVFLNDLKKWALIDGQFDVMPVLNGTPLNAVEFQKAIAENIKALEIKSSLGSIKNRYIDWVYPYLYYFDVSFDNREGDIEKNKISRKGQLMLVPIGATKPTVFQITDKIDDCLYTNSLNDFYAPPNNSEK